jgi:hypothetical protein
MTEMATWLSSTVTLGVKAGISAAGFCGSEAEGSLGGMPVASM